MRRITAKLLERSTFDLIVGCPGSPNGPWPASWGTPGTTSGQPFADDGHASAAKLRSPAGVAVLLTSALDTHCVTVLRSSTTAAATSLLVVCAWS